MFVKLIPFLILAFLLWLFYRSLQRMPAKQKKARILQYSAYALFALLLFAVVTGKVHWLGAVAAGLVAALKFGAGALFRFLPFLKAGSKAGLFKNPIFKTPNIELEIDLKSGQVNGKVLDGEFKGRSLGQLSNTDLDSLLQSLKNTDKRGWYLVGVFRKRHQTNQQHSDANTDQHYRGDTSLAEPTIEEAQLILGLENGYTEKDIQLSYKRLMQKLHPDRGGNDYLASRINLARDLLIKHLQKN